MENWMTKDNSDLACNTSYLSFIAIFGQAPIQKRCDGQQYFTFRAANTSYSKPSDGRKEYVPHINSVAGT